MPMPIFDVQCDQGHASEFIGASASIATHRCECGAPVTRIWTVPTSQVQPDDVPGGFWIENMTAQPLFFRSHSEHRAKMRELGLVNKVRHVNGDKHVPAWGGIDPQTMDNARRLAERM